MRHVDRVAGLWVLVLSTALAVPASAASKCKVFDSCRLLTPSDLSTTLGVVYKAGKEGPNSAKASDGAEVKVCAYSATPADPRIRLTVRCAPHLSTSPDEMRKDIASMYSGATDVPELGDHAFWGYNTMLGGQLNVFVGKKFYVVMSFYQHGLTGNEALAKARKLAALVLKRL